MNYLWLFSYCNVWIWCPTWSKTCWFCVSGKIPRNCLAVLNVPLGDAWVLTQSWVFKMNRLAARMSRSGDVSLDCFCISLDSVNWLFSLKLLCAWCEFRKSVELSNDYVCVRILGLEWEAFICYNLVRVGKWFINSILESN